MLTDAKKVEMMGEIKHESEMERHQHRNDGGGKKTYAATIKKYNNKKEGIRKLLV